MRSDWLSPALVMVISVFGCMVIYSATPNGESTHWRTQALVFLPLGWAAYWFLAMLDYDKLRRHAHRVYFAVVAMLVPLALCALAKKDIGSVIKSVNGARRWIDIGPFKLQPSEFAKFSTLLMFAVVLAGVTTWDWREHRRRARREAGAAGGRTPWWLRLPQVRLAGVALLPIGLIFVQPDLKSCIVYLPMVAALLYVSNLSHRFFAVVGALVMMLVGIVGWDMVGYANHLNSYAETDVVARASAKAGGKLSFARAVSAVDPYQKKSLLFMLKDYQRERILSFVAPDIIDPTGDGTSWNVKQAIIAAGRGGMEGTGWTKGEQARLGYLPELAAHNDFVFSVFAEEFGFLGGASLLAAYAVLVGNMLRVAARARDRFGAYLCVGVAAIFTVHVVVNIGMNLGYMPVSGLPLPFLSYGGSFVLSCFLLLGLVQSVHRYSRALPPRERAGFEVRPNAIQDLRKTAAHPV